MINGTSRKGFIIISREFVELGADMLGGSAGSSWILFRSRRSCDT